MVEPSLLPNNYKVFTNTEEDLHILDHRYENFEYCMNVASSIPYVTSGFHLDEDEIRALLGSRATDGGNSLPTFRDNLAVPSSTVKKSQHFS
jgi:hypothetical protein